MSGMRKSLAVTILLPVILLTGCIQHVMTTDEAADVYLAAVCPLNASYANLGPKIQGLITQGTVSLDDVSGAAQQTYDAERDAVEALDRGDWPSEVDADIRLIQKTAELELVSLDAVIRADTWEEVRDSRWPDRQPSFAAAQRVRIALDLPTDTVEGCRGQTDV